MCVYAEDENSDITERKNKVDKKETMPQVKMHWPHPHGCQARRSLYFNTYINQPVRNWVSKVHLYFSCWEIQSIPSKQKYNGCLVF